ncbi:DUF262 domain-containing protein [Apilactobacillus sp. M161]|uniref:DUF262 domain-containing protein n=1 Tax=Apilactobacillus xinyiensis TaxID=2841032 RepID=A0ABT0I3A0_9LACO|nr:DUF262 domain-containing protein [Apilactobacillus xinyiensis]MCK8625212.1 DUF262 domain-containing protein [Apilactobacillus xinyiensis]
MKIKLHQIPVKDIFKGYKDRGDDRGVVGYDNKLDIRPPYQRNYVYDLDQARSVINTILNNYPLNIMYWVINGNDSYEVLDGQQRTLSVMQFLDHKFSIEWDGQNMYVDSLPDDLYNVLINYKFMIYWCEGSDSEKLSWFKTVNIAGEELTNQELRNITYVGPWLSDAKRHFSKRSCVAKKLSDKYITGDPNRQELLEKALKWISDKQGISINEYMAINCSKNDANELWQYWQDVINWVKKIFPNYHKQMKGLHWGDLYNKYNKNKYNSSEINNDIDKLIQDDEIKSIKGIWQYELAKSYEPNAKKFLNLRTFSIAAKNKKYKEQNGICPICKSEGLNKKWNLSEMEGDHIIPWSKGGKTEYSNLEMLCKKHNESKGNM